MGRGSGPRDGDLRMTRLGTRTARFACGVATLLLAAAAHAQSGVVYKCPGPPVLYTDALTPEEAKSKGCQKVEGAPVTVIQPPRPRPSTANGAAATQPAAATPAARPDGARVDPNEQRRRDDERRAILQQELRREEQRLAEMRREYNDGQPQRLGRQRNFQRYLDRVAQMKADIERKEGDIAAIKRELAKLPN